MTPAIQTANQVGAKCPQYNVMLEAWDLVDDLMGGTAAMKAAGTKWLPIEDKEQPEVYQARLIRSVLFNGYRKAVLNLSRRPFAKPVTLLGGPLPQPLDLIAASTDDEGRNLTQFTYHLLRTALNRGLCHILVDYPTQSPATAKIEHEQHIKPLLIAIDPKNLIDWQYIVASNGEKTLTQIRIAETGTVKTGDFTVEYRPRIRVIEPHCWRLYEDQGRNNTEDWAPIAEGVISLGKIALSTVYLNATGFMTGSPPLDDLAYMNLAHWQSMSDQRNNLRFARAGTVYMLGLSEEEMEKTFVWGVNRIVKSTNANAKIGVAEHSGASTNAGDNELRHLEEMMQALGMEPLVMRTWGNETAMARAIEEGKGQCDLQSWVKAIEAAILKAFHYAAEWVAVKLPEGFHVDVFDDFGMTLRSTQDLTHLLGARQSGNLSQETYLREIRMRGVLSETVDIDDEMARIKKEGPPPGLLGSAPAAQEAQEPLKEMPTPGKE